MSEWEAVVLDLDGGQTLLRCLESIEAQTDRPSKVIVVDNGSLLPVRDRIGERQIEIDLIRLDENRGFTGGVNEGWKRTSAPFVGLINNDVELDPDWARSLLEELAVHAGSGSAQTVIAMRDGRIDGIGIDISAGCFRQSGHGKRSAADLPDPWGVSATAAMYRRKALETVASGEELLHQRFFAYYEDVELEARLRRRGWSSRLVRRVLARHDGSATASRLGWRSSYLRTRNRYFVTRLHPGVGRMSALLAEDLRKIARAVIKGRFGEASAVARGVLAGLVVSPR